MPLQTQWPLQRKTVKLKFMKINICLLKDPVKKQNEDWEKIFANPYAT